MSVIILFQAGQGSKREVLDSQDNLDQDSDLRYMVVGGAEEEELSEPEQMIDFTLATPSTLNLPQAIKEEEETRRQFSCRRGSMETTVSV